MGQLIGFDPGRLRLILAAAAARAGDTGESGARSAKTEMIIGLPH